MFGITTPLQFYGKLVQEFDDFCDDPGSARHAMNFVITAHHMSDWVWKGFLKEDEAKQKQLGMKKSIHGLREWLDGQSIWQAQMQGLANGSKHFQPEGTWVRHITSTFGGAAYSEVPHGGSRTILYVDMGELEGRLHMVPATHIFEAVMRFWRDFMREHSPYGLALPLGKTQLSEP
ncbi:MAG TPA: hypothetical protein VKR55_24005 [Bradyrhizobium sp.]|uniref:hypothetical protein n=1 Tax=Bradyrhizobium sp. TaxID=376 RepID=UPI002BF65EA0|nr:hypothetical protein [Bradyrhizobium sp.]HLZ05200.1 hypothetical protein [Bradyrhizobium sp.]